MPCMGLEPTIAAFERAMTVQILDREATVIGTNSQKLNNISATRILEFSSSHLISLFLYLTYWLSLLKLTQNTIL
jgi:hypothetical protein